MIRRLLPFAFGLVLALSAGCSAIEPRPPAAARDAACLRFFGDMDRRVAGAGVRDAGTARIPGLPELRIDRFLASFAREAMPAEAYGDWVERLRKLDAAARRIELHNLPPKEAAQLQPPFGLDAESAMETCGRRLAESELKSPDRRAEWLGHARVADDYSTWQRGVGLYPLTRWLAAAGVGRLHRELRRPFITAGTDRAAARGPVVRYAPPVGESLESGEIAAILRRSAANPLAIPTPSAAELSGLFATFAPIWAVDTASDSDRIGTVRLGEAGAAFVDPTDPVVYRLASHTRFGTRVLLQLGYLVWFPARPAEGPFDIYAGRFDGLLWRVTLGPDGKPIAYDSVHPCGCYYQIFPGPGFRVVQPEDGSEPVLSPMPIPHPNSGRRLVLRLAERTHYLTGVAPEHGGSAAAVYGWREYDDLRSLPRPGGGHRSLFGEDGLVAGSERPERFLLWPMGVPSAGAMRQWGTHAIAFLGRRHFDDARLLEELLRPIRE